MTYVRTDQPRTTGQVYDEVRSIIEGDYTRRLCGWIDSVRIIGSHDVLYAKYKKEIALLESEVARSAAKLGNEQFVAHAPIEIVASEREKFIRYNVELNQVRSKMEALASP